VLGENLRRVDTAEPSCEKIVFPSALPTKFIGIGYRGRSSRSKEPGGFENEEAVVAEGDGGGFLCGPLIEPVRLFVGDSFFDGLPDLDFNWWRRIRLLSF